MERLFYVLLLVLLWSCKSEVKSESITITPHDVQSIVRYLASDSLKGRNTGTVGIEKSANYIENQLKQLGVKLVLVKQLQEII